MPHDPPGAPPDLHPPSLCLTVNGEKRPFPALLTVAGLLTHLDLDSRKVAIERNLSIVPRSQYPVTALQDGDVLEIVHFIGGG